MATEEERGREKDAPTHTNMRSVAAVVTRGSESPAITGFEAAAVVVVPNAQRLGTHLQAWRQTLLQQGAVPL
jgi:hypothetical protein